MDHQLRELAVEFRYLPPVDLGGERVCEYLDRVCVGGRRPQDFDDEFLALPEQRREYILFHREMAMEGPWRDPDRT